MLRHVTKSEYISAGCIGAATVLIDGNTTRLGNFSSALEKNFQNICLDRDIAKNVFSASIKISDFISSSHDIKVGINKILLIECLQSDYTNDGTSVISKYSLSSLFSSFFAKSKPVDPVVETVLLSILAFSEFIENEKVDFSRYSKRKENRLWQLMEYADTKRLKEL